MYNPEASSVYNPSNHTLEDTFVELKYALRSFEKYGLMENVRKVFVVHSDLYSPPNYLNGEHEQLEFVRHSEIWIDDAKQDGLPNFNRNGIESNLHFIPGLGEWYFALADDAFLLQSFRWRDFIGESSIRVCDGADPSAGSPNSGGWKGGMTTAARLVNARFGKAHRVGDDHEPFLVWKPAVERIRDIWPNVLLSTAQSRYGHDGNVQMSALYRNFMVASKLAEFTTCGEWFTGIHTNSRICPRPCDGYVKDVGPAGLELLQKSLASVTKYRWANLQGPGFDDAYRFRSSSRDREYSPKLTKMVRRWFEAKLGDQSRFED